MTKLKAWLSQGSTIHGIAILVMTAVGYYDHVLSADAALPLVVGAAVAIIMPEKSTDAQKTARDAIALSAAMAAGAGGGAAVEDGISALASDVESLTK